MRTCGERRMYRPTEKISFLLTRGMANHEVLLVLAGSGSRVAAGGIAARSSPESTPPVTAPQPRTAWRGRTRRANAAVGPAAARPRPGRAVREDRRFGRCR